MSDIKPYDTKTDKQHDIQYAIVCPRCPVCGAPKSQFINIGSQENPSGFEENLGFGLGVNRLTANQKNLLIFGGLALGFLFFMSMYALN